jgi:hypothetical protein
LFKGTAEALKELAAGPRQDYTWFVHTVPLC